MSGASTGQPYRVPFDRESLRDGIVIYLIDLLVEAGQWRASTWLKNTLIERASL